MHVITLTGPRTGTWCRNHSLTVRDRGIFAIRHGIRPNSTGLSIRELRKGNGNILKVSGVDNLDSTPILDIKRYVRYFDPHDGVKSGWFDE